MVTLIYIVTMVTIIYIVTMVTPYIVTMVTLYIVTMVIPLKGQNGAYNHSTLHPFKAFLINVY